MTIRNQITAALFAARSALPRTVATSLLAAFIVVPSLLGGEAVAARLLQAGSTLRNVERS